MKKDIYFLSVLFFGNTLFDYHISKNPKDIGIFINYYKLSKVSLNKGKKLFPKLYNFLINKTIINEYLSYEQRKLFKKNINLNSSSEYIENFENEVIYNHQITNFNKNKRNKLSYPKISIIIFCIEYKYLNETINSILNQNFNHYEIILIYDSNEQNDIDLIKKYSKENLNIKIIYNKNKKGMLYGISIGVLSSKGEYILILEPSNILTKHHILNDLYNLISDGNTDILEFNLLINNHETINSNQLIIYKCSHFKSEINLDKINKENIKDKDINCDDSTKDYSFIKEDDIFFLDFKNRINTIEYLNKNEILHTLNETLDDSLLFLYLN